MSMQELIDNYNSKVSEQETIFRDLFGKEELEDARRLYCTCNMRKKRYVDFLKEETERKLREQDGD